MPSSHIPQASLLKALTRHLFPVTEHTVALFASVCAERSDGCDIGSTHDLKSKARTLLHASTRTNVGRGGKPSLRQASVPLLIPESHGPQNLGTGPVYYCHEDAILPPTNPRWSLDDHERCYSGGIGFYEAPPASAFKVQHRGWPIGGHDESSTHPEWWDVPNVFWKDAAKLLAERHDGPCKLKVERLYEPIRSTMLPRRSHVPIDDLSPDDLTPSQVALGIGLRFNYELLHSASRDPRFDYRRFWRDNRFVFGDGPARPLGYFHVYKECYWAAYSGIGASAERLELIHQSFVKNVRAKPVPAHIRCPVPKPGIEARPEADMRGHGANYVTGYAVF